MSIDLYINEVKKRYSSGISTEHSYTQTSIKTAENLAEIMAIKTRMLEKAVNQVIGNEEGGIREEGENNTLREQLEAFRKILIHNLSEREFADMYAQTIAYGMFAARLQEPTKETFSRQDAAFSVPKSNLFLFNLFSYIAGPQIDKRIVWIVDALANVFRASDLLEIIKNIKQINGDDDPFIHFYETFLEKYDPNLRKQRGVYYTPLPIVTFIVRSINQILINEFAIKQGLADVSSHAKEIVNLVPIPFMV